MPTVLSGVFQSELAAHSINASELTKHMEFAVSQEHEGHREVHLPFHCLASVINAERPGCEFIAPK